MVLKFLSKERDHMSASVVNIAGTDRVVDTLHVEGCRECPFHHQVAPGQLPSGKATIIDNCFYYSKLFRLYDKKRPDFCLVKHLFIVLEE